MQPIQFVEASMQAVLAATLTAVFYLSVPLLGMVVSPPQHPSYSFETFGDQGTAVVQMDFVLQPAEKVGKTAEGEAEANGDNSGSGEGKGTSKGDADRSNNAPKYHRRTAAEYMAAREAAVARGAAASKARAEARMKGKCAEPVDAISKLGNNHWRVDRDFVEAYTGDMDKFNSLGAVGIHKDRAGKRDGFFFGRIKCGSPLHQGGLRNGDVVHSVNDQKVHNAMQAVFTYNRLRNKNRIEVDVTRRNGDREVLVYTVR